MEIIAEVGQNHNGDMGLAKELIHAAKENGADVAKFQLYDAITLFPKQGNEWYEYNCKTELSQDQLHLLMDECNTVGIEFMASAFDTIRVQWLDAAGVKRFKIASRSINDFDLIAAVVKTKKTILVSLGMWEKKAFPDSFGDTDIKYLYCISQYPAKFSDLKLFSVDFEKYRGFSDHSIGITAAKIALSRGASIIEKHFTLDKKMYGPDHSGSMVPDELKKLNSFRKELIKCM